MAPGYISLTYDKVVPVTYTLCWQSMGEVAFHFSLQEPINLKRWECKTSFEFIMRKNLHIPFDIIVIATNDKP